MNLAQLPNTHPIMKLPMTATNAPRMSLVLLRAPMAASTSCRQASNSSMVGAGNAASICGEFPSSQQILNHLLVGGIGPNHVDAGQNNLLIHGPCDNPRWGTYRMGVGSETAR
jgi:hypothetical protein